MTLLQVHELLQYWRQHPPLHLLVAAALGRGGAAQQQQDFAALAALAPNGVLSGKGKS